jgi:hypothetical protein
MKLPPSRKTPGCHGRALDLGQHLADGPRGGWDFQTGFFSRYGVLFSVVLAGSPDFLGQL